MSHLCVSEVVSSYDTFFASLYGRDNFTRWQQLKRQLSIVSEKTFVTWMLDTAEIHCSEDKKEAVPDLGPYQNHAESGAGGYSAPTQDVAANSHYYVSQTYIPQAGENTEQQTHHTNTSDYYQMETGGGESQQVMPVKEQYDDGEYEDYGGEGGDASYNNDGGEYGEHYGDDSGMTGEYRDSSIGFEEFEGENDSMVREQGSTTADGAAIIKCRVCKEVFENKLLLITHLKDRHKSSVQCGVCKKIFQSRTTMLRHRTTVHAKSTEHKCNHCPQTFSMRSERLEHEQQEHSEKTCTFQCEYCEKVFTTKRAMQQHVKDIHFNMKTRPCQFCGISFTRQSTLKRHEAVVHLGIKLFTCHVCFKKFGSRAERELHYTRSHSQKALEAPPPTEESGEAGQS